MKLASYKTEKGAQRYASEIVQHFPSVKAKAAVNSDFRWGVYVEVSPGRGAYAGKRPKGYGNATAAQAHIPNREGY